VALRESSAFRQHCWPNIFPQNSIAFWLAGCAIR
jgi:hypothetical protein